MTTAQTQKLEKLEKDVMALKSAILGIVPLDKEGEYKQSSTRRMNALQKKPVRIYRGKENSKT